MQRKSKTVYIFGLLVTAALCFYRFGRTGEMLMAFLFLAVLCRAAYADLQCRNIPDSLPVLIFVTGLCAIPVCPEIGVAERFAGACCVSLPLFFLALLVPGAFGGGDIKMTAACGFFLGGRNMITAGILMIFTAGITGGILLLMKKAERKTCIPLIPFLYIGTMITVFLL